MENPEEPAGFEEMKGILEQYYQERIEEKAENLDEEAHVLEFLADINMSELAATLGKRKKNINAPVAPAVTKFKLLIYKEASDRSYTRIEQEIKDNPEIQEKLNIRKTDNFKNYLSNFKRRHMTKNHKQVVQSLAEELREHSENLDFGRLKAYIGGVDLKQLEPPGEKNPARDWPNYHQAQRNEKQYFRQLAYDLTRNIERKSPSKGRTGYSTADLIFCMLILEYTGKSSRRAEGELEDLKKMGYLDDVPHFNTVLNSYEKPEHITILEKLIRESAKPLENLEHYFAVDSSGLETRNYSKWREWRFGNEDKNIREFRKAHVMVGTNTNIVSAAKATEGKSHDSPHLEDLVEQTCENFTVKQVSADAAYTSRDNMNLVAEHDAIPFFDFPENTSDKSRGSFVWKQLYQLSQQNPEIFEEHYHRRSNAETTMMMFKQKLGKTLRTDKLTCQKNEILAKILAHNLIVLIHYLFSADIEIEFSHTTDSCAEEAVAQK